MEVAQANRHMSLLTAFMPDSFLRPGGTMTVCWCCCSCLVSFARYGLSATFPAGVCRACREPGVGDAK